MKAASALLSILACVAVAQSLQCTTDWSGLINIQSTIGDLTSQVMHASFAVNYAQNQSYTGGEFNIYNSTSGKAVQLPLAVYSIGESTWSVVYVEDKAYCNKIDNPLAVIRPCGVGEDYSITVGAASPLKANAFEFDLGSLHVGVAFSASDNMLIAYQTSGMLMFNDQLTPYYGSGFVFNGTLATPDPSTFNLPSVCSREAMERAPMPEHHVRVLERLLL